MARCLAAHFGARLLVFDAFDLSYPTLEHREHMLRYQQQLHWWAAQRERVARHRMDLSDRVATTAAAAAAAVAAHNSRVRHMREDRKSVV